MADVTYFWTTKFGPGGHNYISHAYLGANPDQAAIDAFILEFEALTVPVQGDPVATLGGHIVSITKTSKRTTASEDIKEVQDVATQNPRLITGRIERLDTTVTPNKILTAPFIMRGVNKGATAPPTFQTGLGLDYRDWLAEFLIKYARVKLLPPTNVFIVKDVLQH